MFINENEMGGECNTHGEEKCALNFLWKPRRGREGDRLEGIDADGGVILKLI